MGPTAIAPSPAASSPSPVTSNFPAVLTPAASSTVNKPPSFGQPPISVTKTWILPPKPKPGRKPAVDAPPTKRKAQNREAQRAFRERRAAKVAELEEEMRKMEEEDAREQEELRGRIETLEGGLREYERLLAGWQDSCREFEGRFASERERREQMERELEALRQNLGKGSEAVPLPPRRNSKTNTDREQPMQRPNDEELQLGCGKCSAETRCQCIEEAFEMSDLATMEDQANPAETFKRPHSPPSTYADFKRQRQSASFDPEAETDFTTQFASRPRPRPPTFTTSASTSSIAATTAPPDPCGFCSDGTPCICAEISNDRSRQHHDSKPPPPSAPLPPPTAQVPSSNAASTLSDPCANGPGTCTQCRTNSTSKLFCQSIAAARPPLSNPPIPASSNPPTPASTSTSKPTLPCATAFTLLSAHPAFPSARAAMDTWVPQLTAVPRVGASAAAGWLERTTAFDIEAASVMSVLRTFDRRFRGPDEVGEGEIGGKAEGGAGESTGGRGWQTRRMKRAEGRGSEWAVSPF